MSKIIYVSKTRSGANVFQSITAALSSLDDSSQEPVTIEIAPGIYHEKIEIRRDNLTIVGTGTSPEEVVLTYDDFAFDDMPDGSKRGTFRSYSVFLDASNVTMKNLSIENASGDENTHGQAIALYAEGDHLYFENLRLIGRQDTLFTGPLPPKELQPNGFIGPKQFSPRINGRQYYKDCYICGNIDFIFGSATAYFEHCRIESLSHKSEPHAIQGYVSAPSTPEGQEYGYVFYNCSFLSKECAASTCYLARPWRDFAKAVFIQCEVGPHIHPEGFHDWNKPNAREHAFFAAYGNYRPSGTSSEPEMFSPKAPFSKELSTDEIAKYKKDEVLS